MQAHTIQPNQWIQYAVTAVVIGLVLFFRLRRMSKVRPLKLETLWVVPALYGVLAVGLFVAAPPHGLGWLWSALALAIGAAIGWQRGKLMHITVDPATHALNHRASPAAVLLLVALIAVRAGARAAIGTGDNALHLNAMTLTDLLVALAVGLFAATRLEMYLRAKRLLGEARAIRA